MKTFLKKASILFLALIFVLSLAACGGSGDSAGNKNQPASTQVSFNQKIIVGDVMEITFESSEWTDEIKPSDTSGAYSYKSDNEGEKYFVIKGKVKNIAGENLDISYAHESGLVINGQYKAPVYIDAEEADGTGFYGEVKPLQTLNFIAYTSVSDELYDTCEDITITFNLLSDSSRLGYFFDMDDKHETYHMNFVGDEVVDAPDYVEKESQTSNTENEAPAEANLELGKTVTVGDVMEITFETSEWAEEIKPSDTSGAYSYKGDNEGEKYFVIKGKVKNIAGENLDISYAHESELVINGKYKATIHMDAEEADGTGFYGEIKPLQTLNIIAYASVSEDLYDIYENASATFNILSDSSRLNYFFDVEDDEHETYCMTFTK